MTIRRGVVATGRVSLWGMSRVAPVEPRVRLAIVQWPPDAPRGAVTTFCAEQGISRKAFYAIRGRALSEGQAAALEPRSRRPRSSPSKLGDSVADQANGVRAALEASGLDHGPIGVHEKMTALGMRPYRRWHHWRGSSGPRARLEPRRKPRAAFRRFVYPAPNAC